MPWYDHKRGRVQATYRVVNDYDRRPVSKGTNFTMERLGHVMRSYKPGLSRPRGQRWDNEKTQRDDANDAIDAYMDTNCHFYDRGTWADRFDSCVEMYSHVADVVLDETVGSDDRVCGDGAADIPRHFETVQKGALAMLVYKHALGFNRQSTHNTKLRDIFNSDDELYLCWVVPTVRFLLSHLQNEDMDLDMAEVLDIDVYTWEEGLKRKYKTHGWWSQRHIAQRLRIEDTRSQGYIRKHHDSHICRGIEYNFMRFLVLTIRDFRGKPRGKRARGTNNPVKVFATPEECDAMGAPLSDPPLRSQYQQTRCSRRGGF